MSAKVDMEASLKQKSKELPRKQRVAKRIGGILISGLSLLPTAAVAALPAADYFGAADLSVVKAYSIAHHDLDTSSRLGNTLIDNGLAGALALGESAAMGLAISKSKRLKGTYKMMDKSYEEKRNKRGPVKRAAVKVATSPLWVLEKVGDSAEWAGKKISKRKTKIARDIGKVAVDFGETLAATSTGVIADETFEGNPPSIKRTLWLSSLGSVALLGLIETGRLVDQVPFLRVGMNSIAHGFDMATNINSPIGDTLLSTAVFGLAYTGMNVARFRRDHPVEAENTQPVNAVATSNGQPMVDH